MGFLGSDYPKLELLCPLKKNSPKLHVWDITLVLLFYTICSQLSVIIQLRGFFFFTSQDQCLIFVFLGFLTLLANFGLVTPTPDGIRVLGVETPLRT